MINPKPVAMSANCQYMDFGASNCEVVVETMHRARHYNRTETGTKEIMQIGPFKQSI